MTRGHFLLLVGPHLQEKIVCMQENVCVFKLIDWEDVLRVYVFISVGQTK